ncbi:hypothetical protein TPHA_0G03160 [Tetrapisispora phaffii CBS 4417]|uniref:Aminotransferase class I/classII large domain-containing protein n=1 Tax=Tetrapisispora phaffii (strain ATCC 24235 / CBS 4417 / NBRC 1672 / NRRL Y-8282 / UCD 70-5) TaxID=1071381 RepID=G8BW78_TETPH|nr:hypothetical protein TPHA_0G03160 [Tetrapisispora phaffii CBS 4417]CCE64156.1 hypothetical protein TPHA_0G03160 [Tetrapisispora phaffii CBS 4417]
MRYIIPVKYRIFKHALQSVCKVSVVFRRFNYTCSKLVVPEAPSDKILGLNDLFKRDQNKNKVNLTVGIYKDEKGSVTTLLSILEAQKIVEKSNNHDLSYLPIAGHEGYRKAVKRFLFDECVSKGEIIEQERISLIQTLSGTGALAITSRFLSTFVSDTVWISDPSWVNHDNIFEKNGFKNINHYSYVKNGILTVDEWLDDLKRDPGKDKSTKPQAVVLHACCHNPTGIDPTKEEWERILDEIYNLNMIPIVDMAYQGLDTGNLKNDAYLLKMILNEKKYKSWSNGIFVCQSFAKNMGLYSERVGSLSIVVPPNSEGLKKNIDSQLQKIVRSIYSSPPSYGSKIAYSVLSDPILKEKWFQDVEKMVNRLTHVRMEMHKRLEWPDLINKNQQHGMFYFINLNEKQIKYLRDKYSIYLTLDGRMSLSGVNSSNIDYVCAALKDAIS